MLMEGQVVLDDLAYVMALVAVVLEVRDPAMGLVAGAAVLVLLRQFLIANDLAFMRMTLRTGLVANELEVAGDVAGVAVRVRPRQVFRRFVEVQLFVAGHTAQASHLRAGEVRTMAGKAVCGVLWHVVHKDCAVRIVAFAA